jgi:prolyl-tRNA editing enzyme YbaK/EbsC (Cys-tRNA(Pro) deacylase)
MKAAVARVVAALHEAGVETEIKEFAESTRTAEDAAAAIGTSVGQIVKSLVFMAGDSPILALVSGTNRADVKKLGALTGQPIRRADADAVRAATGYTIGGVPPIGHASRLTTYIDRDLLQYDLVWAAAGTPNAVFSSTPQRLMQISDAQAVDLASAPGETA